MMTMTNMLRRTDAADVNVRSEGLKPARVAVLFSGGIDSTILACLAHRHIPLDEPIDLLNVAFENPRKIQLKVEGNFGGFTREKKKAVKRALRSASHSAEDISGDGATKGENDLDYLVPDRVTGLQEVEELRRVCKGRTWNFVRLPFVSFDFLLC